MAARNDTSNCVIGDGSVFEGRFYVNGSVYIQGKFQGDIKTDDQLIVGENGKVKTDIEARRVEIAGTLIGNITASEEVRLVKSGKVLGNIVTPKLTVEPGVLTSGKVTITSGQSTSVDSTIQDSYGAGAAETFEQMFEQEPGTDGRPELDQSVRIRPQ